MSAATGPGVSHHSAAEPSDESGGPLNSGNENPDDHLSGLVDGEFIEETTPPEPTGRRAARAVAVQALYESDVTGHPGVPAVRRLAAEARLAAGLAEFAETLVARVEQDRTSLDARIAEAAPAFPTGQLAAVDRNILRVALAELAADLDTPQAVVVNEAVEVARLFGSEGAPGFVNGVLGSVLR